MASMWEPEINVARGLAGVVAATTKIALIDGQQGKLYYRGYDAIGLARSSSYEEVAYLLLFGELPTVAQLESFCQMLAENRALTPGMLDLLKTLPGAPKPMDALRTAVASMAATDASPSDASRSATLRRAARVIAQMPTVVAAHWRLRQGESPIPPDPSLDHASNFVYMLFGRMPREIESRFMNMALVLMAEHGLNASTFAARVTASTLADIYSAFTSAIGTLNGPLHGAANSEAMKMLLEIGSEDNVEAYIKGQLAIGKRIMGFGHRVYKTADPRAVILREVLVKLDDVMPDEEWCSLAMAVEDEVHKQKALYPNVDFFCAPALYSLGVPMELFTTIFACSRSVGWAAHIQEQYDDNRIYRPSAVYNGPAVREPIPLKERK
jgi:citrate synthase